MFAAGLFAAQWYVDDDASSGWSQALISSSRLGPWNLSRLPALPDSVPLLVTVNGTRDTAWFRADKFADKAAVTANELRSILNGNFGDYSSYYPGYLDSCYCLDSMYTNKIFIYTRGYGATKSIKIDTSWIADSLGLDTTATHFGTTGLNGTSQINAFNSVKYAIDKGAGAGDTVYVYNGTYNGTIYRVATANLLVKNVAGQNNVIYKDDGIGRTVCGWCGRVQMSIDGVHITFDGIKFDFRMNHNLTFQNWMDGSTFLNCDFTGNDTTANALGFGSGGGEYTRLYNCKVHNFKYTGISCGGKIFIDSCEIYSNCLDSQWYQQGAIWSTSGTETVKVTKCRIYDNYDYAFKFRYNNTNIILIDNLIYRNGGGISRWGTTSTSGCKYISNTIVKNKRHGFDHVGGASPDSIRWNIMYWNGWGNPGTYYDFNEQGTGSSPVEQYNDIGRMADWKKSIFTMGQDPRFVDTLNNNYHLAIAPVKSPCIDITGYRGAGRDLEGRTRPLPTGSSWDMGCFEEPDSTKSDVTPPNSNSLTLRAFSYGDSSFILYWTPGSITGTDRELVGIFYKTTDYPDSAADPSARFLEAYALADSVDTVGTRSAYNPVYNFSPDSTYWFAGLARDSSLNWSDSAASACVQGKLLRIKIDSSAASIDEYGAPVCVTNDGTVDLLLQSSAADSMRFSNSGRLGEWSAWEGIANSRNNWSVISGNGGTSTSGRKFIYFQVKTLTSPGYVSQTVRTAVYFKNTRNVCVIRNSTTVSTHYLIDIAHDTSTTQNGDTIEVRDDSTYYEFINLTKSVYLRPLASPVKRPKIANADSSGTSVVTLSINGAVVCSMRINGGYKGRWRSGACVYVPPNCGGSVKNCSLYNAAQGVQISYGGGVVTYVLDNVIDSVEQNGIWDWNNGGTVVIRGNTIRNVRDKGYGGWLHAGLFIYGGTGHTYERNIIYNCDGFGVSQRRDATYNTGNTFINNLIYNCAGGGIGPYDANRSYNNKYKNNTIYGCTGNGLSIASNAAYTDSVTNNILWNNGNGTTTFDLTADSVGTAAGKVAYNDIKTYNSARLNNGIAASNISRYPQFADTTNKNYQLKRWSPCINRGQRVPVDTVDIRRVRRPANYWDMGAYEYQGPSLARAVYYGWQTPTTSSDDTLRLYFDKKIKRGELETGMPLANESFRFYGYGSTHWEGAPTTTYAQATTSADSTLVMLVKITGSGTDSSLARCLSRVRCDSLLVHDAEYDSFNTMLDSQFVLTYSVRNKRNAQVYLTLQTANDTSGATTGDTLQIQDTVGVYWEALAGAKNLAYFGVYGGGKKPKLTHQVGTPSGTWPGNNTLFNINNNYRLRNMELDGQGTVVDGISYSNAGGSEVDSCIIHDFSNTAFPLGCNRGGNIRYCRIYNVQDAINACYSNGSYIFENNTIYNCSRYGINLQTSDQKKTIINNVIYHCINTGLKVDGTGGGYGGCYNVIVKNNTVYGCGTGIVFGGDNDYGATTNNYKNNIFWGNTLDVNYLGDADQTVNRWMADYNCYQTKLATITAGPHDVTTYPMFRDTVNHDFRLTKYSKVINKAEPKDSAGTDIRRVRRPNNFWDIGAYEYQGASLRQAVFYGWQTPANSTDDTLRVYFDKNIKYGNLDTNSTLPADSNFVFYGMGSNYYNNQATIKLHTVPADSTQIYVVNTDNADSGLVRGRSWVKLESLAVRDAEYDTTNSVHDSIPVQNYSIRNVNDNIYFLTLQKGVDSTTTANGETLEVQDTIGVYAETLDITKSLAVRRITGAGLAKATIGFGGLGINGTTYEGWVERILVRPRAWDITLTGLKIDGCNNQSDSADVGIMMWSCNNLIVRNCEIYNTENRGMHVGNSYTIDSCLFHHTSGTGVWDYCGNGTAVIKNSVFYSIDHGPGVWLYGSGTVSDHTVERNRIYNCGSGINLRNTHGNTVRNNLVYDCMNDGIFLANNEAMGDIKLLNNTGFSNGGNGITLNSAVTHLVKNNICYNNAGVDLDAVVAGLPRDSISYNCLKTTTVRVDTVGGKNCYTYPLFADTSVTRDLHLRVHSPCIDRGDTAAVFKDFPDNGRNDMGAYGGPYTIDTLQPNRPDSVRVARKQTLDTLHWSVTDTTSFGFYAIYRDTAGPAFVPALANCIDSILVSTRRETTFTHNNKEWYYKVSMARRRLATYDTSYGGGYAADSSVIPTVRVDSAVYYSCGTVAMTDDSLVVYFNTNVRDDSLHLGVGHADSTFGLLGPGYLNNGTLKTGSTANDHMVVVNFTANDTIFSHNRTRLRLLPNTVYAMDNTPCAADTDSVRTWNVYNLTTDSAYPTIQAAYNADATPALLDTMMVFDAGLYTDTLHLSKKMVVAAIDTSRRPVIGYNGTGMYGLHDTAKTMVVIDAADTMTFDGFAVDGGNGKGDSAKYVIEEQANGRHTIRRCKVYNGRQTGIHTWAGASRPLLIEHNEVYAIGRVGIDPQNIDSAVVRRNRVHDINDRTAGFAFAYGINAQDLHGCFFEDNIIYNIFSTGNNTKGIALGNSERLIIRNNIIYNAAFGLQMELRCTSLTIQNNTCYGVNTGLYLDDQNTHRVRNNIFWGNATFGITALARVLAAESLTYNCSQSINAGTINTGGTGNIALNPLFADSVNRDFHLRVHSPCIDRGDSALYTDKDGGRVDLGAFGGPFAIDTLMPPRLGQLVVRGVGTKYLSDSLYWGNYSIGDFRKYFVYRDTFSAFVPTAANCIDSTLAVIGTTGRSYTNNNKSYMYKVSAQDNSFYGGGYRAGSYGRIYVAKDANRTTTIPNDTMTYKLYYDNDGEVASVDTFFVYDYLPPRAKYVDTTASSLHTGGSVRVAWYMLNSTWRYTPPLVPDSVAGLRWAILPGIGAQEGSGDAGGADLNKTGIDTTQGADAGVIRFRVRIQ
jgi:parallel beta-helix repeat protein